MSFFGKILDKLGMGGASAPAARPAAGRTVPSSSVAAQSPPQSVPQSTPPQAPSPEPVDVTAQLEQRAAANPQKLNWRTSIVDLLKLLEIDSSLTARKALATELGCPSELLGDSARMNVWLHKTVLARVAANGGEVPQELLDRVD